MVEDCSTLPALDSAMPSQIRPSKGTRQEFFCQQVIPFCCYAVAHDHRAVINTSSATMYTAVGTHVKSDMGAVLPAANTSSDIVIPLSVDGVSKWRPPQAEDFTWSAIRPILTESKASNATVAHQRLLTTE